MDYDKIQNASFMMLEAFKDFKQVLENERGEASKAAVGPLMEVKPMKSADLIEEAFKYLMGNPSEEEDYDADCIEDFPGRRHFKYEDINADDSRFYGGMEVGIPYAVAVRNEEGQGMLIPISHGMFGGY